MYTSEEKCKQCKYFFLSRASNNTRLKCYNKIEMLQHQNTVNAWLRQLKYSLYMTGIVSNTKLRK